MKKTKEISEGIGEGLGKAGETIYKQGQNIGQSAPFKTVSSVSSLLVKGLYHLCHSCIQLNLNSSNTDGSFTMVNSNSFLSPLEILLIAQENKF